MKKQPSVIGFVVVGPKGMFPGTFSEVLDDVLRSLSAVAVLNRYDPAKVKACPAELKVTGTTGGITLDGVTRRKIRSIIKRNAAQRKGR